MQSIEKEDLKQLGDRLDLTLRNVPELRHKLHEQLGDMALKAVRGKTPERTGRLKSWQEKHVGSMGGYAAIRATDKNSKENPSPGPSSPGAVTNYAENGHVVRPRAAKYSRQTMAYVAGRKMYANAIPDIEREAAAEAEKLLDEVVSKI